MKNHRYRQGRELTLLGAIEAIQAGDPVIVSRQLCTRAISSESMMDETLRDLIDLVDRHCVSEAIRVMSAEEVIAELNVLPPIAVHGFSSDNALDEDGGVIDPRQLQPYVWALGPFGSWPETETKALETIREHNEWLEGKSFRVGRCAIWKPGWGFALKEHESSE